MATMKGKMLLFAAVAGLMTLIAGIAGIVGMKRIDTYVVSKNIETRHHADALLDVSQAHLAFKNQIHDFKNILIRGNDPARFEKYLADFSKLDKTVEKELGEARANIEKAGMPPEILKQLEAAQREHKLLSDAYAAAIKQFNVADPNAGKAIDKLVTGKDQAVSQALFDLEEKVRAELVEQFKEQEAQVQSFVSQTLVIVVALVVVGLAAVIGVSTWVTRSVLTMLGGEPADATAAVRRVAEGDLTPSGHGSGAAPDSLLGAVERMREAVRNMVVQLHGSSEQLASAAHSMAQQSSDVASSNARHGEAVSSMAAAMEQMATSIAQVADNSSDAHDNAVEAGRLSLGGADVINNATEEMLGIAGAMQQATEKIQALEEQSGNISAIVSVINEIANQTNLLALNAAIEAARAGEQGRGFAVVADEVRKLAERTAQSTQEIGGMIQAMRQVTESAVQAMDVGNARVTAGVEKAGKAADSIGLIKNGSDVVLRAVDDISSALAEQRTTTQDVAQSVESVARMNEDNIRAVDAVAAAATEVEAIAQRLKDDAHRFRV